jgi:hypothetical protein
MKARKIKKKMKLSDILKQFKNIEPGAQFSERSRRQILLSPQGAPMTIRGVFAFLHIIETGAAVALAGFFILILTGSFSPTASIAPIQYSVIDPQGLHAEAQAIDMQIELADIQYPQATSTASPESTAPSPATLTKVFAAALGAQASSTASTSASVSGTSSSTASSTASTTLSVDQALQQLSQ